MPKPFETNRNRPKGKGKDRLARTIDIAERRRFSLDGLAYQYPEEATMPGLTPPQALEKLTWEGAAARYPDGLPGKVSAILTHELRLPSTRTATLRHRRLLEKLRRAGARRNMSSFILYPTPIELRVLTKRGVDAHAASLDLPSRSTRSISR
jgi:hypothetical protein